MLHEILKNVSHCYQKKFGGPVHRLFGGSVETSLRFAYLFTPFLNCSRASFKLFDNKRFVMKAFPELDLR